MRPSLCRSCLAFLLKLLNFLQAFVGVTVVLYSVWMLSQWDRRDSGLRGGLGFDFGKLPDPWFAYLILGVGLLVCLIAFTGHVATEAINGCCLCFYATLTSILILFEAVLVGVLVLNKRWEEDLPYDPTGELDRLRKFVECNIDIWKWIGVVVVVIQAFSLLLAIILRGMASSRSHHCDCDEDLVVARTPLLYSHYGAASASTSMDGKICSDIWSARMREKYGLNQGDFSYASAEPKLSPYGNSVSSEDRRLCCIL